MKQLFLTTIVSFFILLLNAQSIISGVFQASEAAMVYEHGLKWPAFQHKNDSLNQNGYRLFDLETYKGSGDRTFWGIWIKSDLPAVVESVYGWTSFVEKKRAMTSDSFLLTKVTAYAVSDKEQYYIGVWMKEDTPHKVWKLDSREGLAQKTEEMARQDFFIRNVEVFSSPNKTLIFLALFHKGKVTTPRNYVYTSDDLKVFKTNVLQRQKSGFRLVDFESFEEKGTRWYLGVFEKGDYETVLLEGQETPDFNGRWEILEEQGLRLMDIELGE